MGQPSTDRYWRVYVGLGVGILALGVALAIAFIILTPPRALSLASLFGGELWSDLAAGGCVALLGVAALVDARKRYRRERQRARALAGDEAAMVLARVKPHGVAPADLEAGPLELLWLPERASWSVVGVAIFFALLVIGIFTTIVVAVVEGATFAESGAWETPWSVIAGGASVGALVIALGVWLRARPRTDASGVVATREGLRAIRAGKEQAFIPWSEARLLEAWKAGQQEGFALAGGPLLVEWRDYPQGKGPAAADGASSEAMYLRAQTLLQTVIARTGLEPRACAPILTFEEQLDGPIVGWGSWLAALLGYAFLIAIVGALLLTAVSAPLLPLTHSLALNWYIAVTMGGLGLAPLVWLARAAIRRMRDAPAPPVERPAVQLPAPPAPGVSPLAMRVLRAWRDNAILMGILLLVAVEVYALVRVFTDTILPFDAPPSWWTLPMLSAMTLGFTSFIAGAIACAGLVSREPRGVLDERGLRVRRGPWRILIPWSMVAELVITVARGKVSSYKVVAGDSQRTELSWPDDVGLDGATLAPGESPGALFAAAIAQRAGLTPRVVYK